MKVQDSNEEDDEGQGSYASWRRRLAGNISPPKSLKIIPGRLTRLSLVQADVINTSVPFVYRYDGQRRRPEGTLQVRCTRTRRGRRVETPKSPLMLTPARIITPSVYDRVPVCGVPWCGRLGFG